MASVTLRDLPPELHKRLKESAERNRRSLNAEIIWRLEHSPIEPVRTVSVQEVKERAARFREHLRKKGFKPFTDDEIREAIRQGRP